MNTTDWIRTMVDRIVAAFAPERVILFGSHARGDAGPQSDVDLLVILAAATNKREAAVAIRRVLADIPLCKDIIVTTLEEVARRGSVIGTVLLPALREGRVLYERG